MLRPNHPLEAAFRKLTAQLGSGASFTLNNLDQALSFRPFAPGDTDVDTFQQLMQALQDRRVVSFLYRNLGAERAQKRTVHPYHLACIDSHWYLFAFDESRKAMRTFVLTRLSDLEVKKRIFTVSAKFDANEHLKGSLSVFKGTDDYEVVIDFDRWAADLVRGRRWHASQDITELPKGQMRMRMRLNSIEEAERWVLDWGTHATVVRPKALAKALNREPLYIRGLLSRFEVPLLEGALYTNAHLAFLETIVHLRTFNIPEATRCFKRPLLRALICHWRLPYPLFSSCWLLTSDAELRFAALRLLAGFCPNLLQDFLQGLAGTVTVVRFLVFMKLAPVDDQRWFGRHSRGDAGRKQPNPDTSPGFPAVQKGDPQGRTEVGCPVEQQRIGPDRREFVSSVSHGLDCCRADDLRGALNCQLWWAGGSGLHAGICGLATNENRRR